MKTVIFYFSGTGNTWWVSRRLKEELESLGNSVEMFSLENPELHVEGFASGRIASADCVVVGYPVYGSDMPENVKNFITRLPVAKGAKRFCAFCTQAGFSGDACLLFRREIEEKGYLFRQSFQIDMTTNFNVAIPPFSFSKPATGGKLDKIKDKAASKIKGMAAKIAGDELHVEGRRFYQVLLGGLQRFFFRRGAKKMPRKFQFLAQRCVKCKICANTCPTGNIVLQLEPLSMSRGDRCLLCFRCYNFCPSLAINYGMKVSDPEKYRRYPGPVKELQISEIRK